MSVFNWMRSALVVAFLLTLAISARAAATPNPVRVEVSRDAWISSYPKEQEGNNGGSPRLKLKGIQEFFLIDFDPTPLHAKRVVRAELHLHLENAEVLGRITVSSVTDEWVEGGGTGYAKTPGASSFLWARNGTQRWCGDGPDLTGVVLGNGGSIWGFGDASPRDADGWQVIPIDPAVVQARLDGRSYGFFVMDDVGSEYTRKGNTIEYRLFPNRYVASREGPRKTAPYFALWLADGTPTAAAPSVATSRSVNPKPAPLPKAVSPVAASAIPPNVSCRTLHGEALESLDFFVARNEAIGYFLEVSPSELKVAGVPDVEVTLFATPRVGGHVDPLVPPGLSAPVDGRDGSNGTFVELYVAAQAKPGRHAGHLEIRGRRYPFSLTVWNFTLPDRLSFIPQMNCYGLPADEMAYYRLAHEHRTTLNCLRYGWTGRVARESVPRRQPDGSWDWAAWDQKFGPLLDGSAFRGLRRDGIPVDSIYLPLNENWPMDHEKHFKGGYWIETAYDDAYWQEFRTTVREFSRHFALKGWTEPVFEFYLNNKVYFKHDRGDRWDACSAPWIFDEPMNTQDFWALRRFGLEFGRGVGGQAGPRFAFRADLSRPEWQRDLLDGVTSVEVVSGALRTYRERVIRRAERWGNLVYMYGSANRIGTPNSMPAAWCVETWALGADGVVPWQTVGKADSWKVPDPLALFYPTAQGPVPSVRLKAFRAGQQLVEYLTLYTALSGQSRAAVGAAVLAETDLCAVLEKRSEADAGTSRFGPAAARALERLRLRLGAWLDSQAPKPRNRWHDPRPQPRNPDAVREIQVVRVGD